MNEQHDDEQVERRAEAKAAPQVGDRAAVVAVRKTTMTAARLLDYLEDAGFEVLRTGPGFTVGPSARLTDRLRALITAHAGDLRRLLAARDTRRAECYRLYAGRGRVVGERPRAAAIHEPSRIVRDSRPLHSDSIAGNGLVVNSALSAPSQKGQSTQGVSETCPVNASAFTSEFSVESRCAVGR